jgi:lambda family phage minor tail protein L
MSESPKITAEVQKLEQDALVELFVLDLTRQGGGVQGFHNQRANGAGVLTFGTQTFEPVPLEASGFALNGAEQPATPTLKVANIGSLVTALAAQYNGLINARVTRLRTFRRHLADGEDPDPTARFAEDVYFINRKVDENRLSFEVELGSSLDVDGVQLPFRKMLPRCQAVFKDGVNCPYAGPDTTCLKTVAACQEKFGAGVELPYLGFPAVERARLSY